MASSSMNFLRSSFAVSEWDGIGTDTGVREGIERFSHWLFLRRLVGVTV